jgi:hypothetical protein
MVSDMSNDSVMVYGAPFPNNQNLMDPSQDGSLPGEGVPGQRVTGQSVQRAPMGLDVGKLIAGGVTGATLFVLLRTAFRLQRDR